MSAAADTVKTQINFFNVDAPIMKVAVLNGPKRTPRTHDVLVTDARRSPGRSGLDNGGFILARHQSLVRDFRDPEQIRAIYHDEIVQLIKEKTGADLVITFHGQIRDNNSDVDPGKIRKPARSAHIDYIEDTFRGHAEPILRAMGERPETWLNGRFAAYNIWRGLGPVEELPLAVCDARTVLPEDLHVVEIEERPGSNDGFKGQLLGYNPLQHWYYYPDMQPDEVLIFKQCDTDPKAPQKCPHTAIEIPDQPPARHPRTSFDIRAMAFFRD